MSALNIYVSANRADIFTDGAAYEQNGEVAGFMAKVVALPQIGGAVAWVGSPAVGYVVASLLCSFSFSCVEELKESFGKLLRKHLREVPGLIETSFEFIVAGSSNAGGVKALHFASRSQSDGRKPFEPKFVRKFTTPHSAGFATAVSEFDGSKESAIRLMEEQRRVKFQTQETMTEIFGVGGFCHQTAVTSDALAMSVLKRWPDEIGKVIVPQ